MARARFRVYGDVISGNCQKVKVVADRLGLAYEWVAIDVGKGEARTPEFRARNPAAQVPVVELADGRCLAQSNAIIRYLARDSDMLPGDPFLAAKMDEWMFWEQYSHEPYVAVARFQVKYLGRAVSDLEPRLVVRGNAALDLMEETLSSQAFFVGEAMTLADVALLPYTRMAADGGFDLSGRPNVRSWIGRCEDELQIEGKRQQGTEIGEGSGGGLGRGAGEK